MALLQEIIYIKRDGAHVINLDEYRSTKTHWIALYMHGNGRSASSDQA